jgi:hypothetical protein
MSLSGVLEKEDNKEFSKMVPPYSYIPVLTSSITLRWKGLSFLWCTAEGLEEHERGANVVVPGWDRRRSAPMTYPTHVIPNRSEPLQICPPRGGTCA